MSLIEVQMSTVLPSHSCPLHGARSAKSTRVIPATPERVEAVQPGARVEWAVVEYQAEDGHCRGEYSDTTHAHEMYATRCDLDTGTTLFARLSLLLLAEM